MKAYLGIDLQKDFMDKDGGLQVPGAEDIKDNVANLTQSAEEKDILVLLTVDEHDEHDIEFEIFPKHCVKDTEGQELILEAIGNMEPPYIVERDIKCESNCFIMGDCIVFPKATYDIFDKELGNDMFLKTIKGIDITEVIVYGVATNVCVIAAVEGLLKEGINVKLVEDAMAGIPKNENVMSVEEAIRFMVDNGAELVKTAEVIA